MIEKRRVRQRREDLRALLLETGASIVREEGLGTGAEVLTFKRVFDRVEKDTGVRLTNASIIRRVWENQAEFQTDVLVAIASSYGESAVERTIAALAAIYRGMDRSTEESRMQIVRELIRVSGDARVLRIRYPASWQSWVGVWALAPQSKSADHGQRIKVALTDSYEASIEKYLRAYEGMAALFGIRLRENLTLRQFTIAAECLSEGFELRRRIDSTGMMNILRPSGPNGEDQKWTLFSIAMEGLVNQFFETDPHWQLESRPT